MLNIVGSNIIKLQKVASTNNYANKISCQTVVKEGSVFYADFQTKGKGQNKNVWHSEKNKNILCSIVLYPDFLNIEYFFVLNQVISLGIIDFLIGYNVSDCRIKWPNDIYINDKKICGILIENTLLGDTISKSIVGIGININQTDFPSDLPNPISLKNIINKSIAIEDGLETLAKCINLRYNQLIDGDFLNLNNDYINLLYKRNILSAFLKEGLEFKGTIQGVDKSGELIIKNGNGKTEQYQFNQVKYII